jgi:hypothetical protein
LLRWAGIDSAEDLDDARLRAEWKIGHEALESRIGHLKEARYLSGGGSSFPERPQIARSGHEQHLGGAVSFAAPESWQLSGSDGGGGSKAGAYS